MSDQIKDDRGNEIKVGDVVRVTALDAGRGAHLWLTQSDLDVVSIGRTRIKVIGPFIGSATVGGELCRVTQPVDGRVLQGMAPLADLTKGN